MFKMCINPSIMIINYLHYNIAIKCKVILIIGFAYSVLLVFKLVKKCSRSCSSLSSSVFIKKYVLYEFMDIL